MKKMISILLCALMATAFLASCGSADYAPAANESYGRETSALRMMAGEYDYTDYEAPMAAPAPPAAAPDAYYDSMAMYDSGEIVYAEKTSAGSGFMPITAPAAEGMAEKIIYSVYADVETLKFEETIDMVYQLLVLNNAFIETSNVSGINHEARYYGWNQLRYAYFSLRVPKDRLNIMTASLDSLGNVTNLNSSAQNITSQFFDTQSRLNSLLVQEERLLDMLRKADEVTDLIAIEERLADVRYQIESYTTTLNNWQNQVDYSTLSISIREVEEYTEPTPVHRSYWEQVRDGLMATIRSTGKFFTDLFKWFIVNLPVLIILAVITVVTVLIVRKKLRDLKNKDKLPGFGRKKENSSEDNKPNDNEPDNN